LKVGILVLPFLLKKGRNEIATEIKSISIIIENEKKNEKNEKNETTFSNFVENVTKILNPCDFSSQYLGKNKLRGFLFHFFFYCLFIIFQAI